MKESERFRFKLLESFPLLNSFLLDPLLFVLESEAETVDEEDGEEDKGDEDADDCVDVEVAADD
jgi:hypothetical protein